MADEQKQNDDERKLFIGGLPQDITESEIREHFAGFGSVASVTIKMDPVTGRSRGFAFVVYEDLASLDPALKEEFHDIKGKKVAVKKAAAKQGKIYVGKFSGPITEDEIKNHFSQYGNVVEVQRPVDRSKDSEPKNFCFVTFAKEETANTLLKKGSETVAGQSVDLKKVTLKQDGGNMGGGRGGRGGGRGGMGGGYGQQWGGYGGAAGGAWGGYGGQQWGGGYGDAAAGGWGGYGGGQAGGWGGYGGQGGGKMGGMGGGFGGGRGGRGGRGGNRQAPY